MKKVVFFLLVCFAINKVNSQVTKTDLCKGATLSIVYTMSSAVRSEMEPEKVKEMIDRSFEKVVHPQAKKSYDLLKAGKARKDVIAIIQEELMKLDDEVVFKGLLKSTDE